MQLQSLQITNFRNISSILLTFSKKFNAICGENAAGKSSLLEAILYLSQGKSFRSLQHEAVISHGSSEFTIFSLISSDENDAFPLGIQRNLEGSLSIRHNETSIRSIAEISKLLPMLFIGSDSHRILTDGPKVRRQFLDWGLFYTFPQFYPQWRDYQKILSQRNAAIKSQASRHELYSWNLALTQAGEALHQFRKSYLDDFLPFFNELLSIFLKETPISLNYLPGWDSQFSLLESLNHLVRREQAVGYTLAGPHRADLALSVDNLSVTNVLSQGQLKLVAYALHLSQGMYLKSHSNRAPIFLIDDLPSELDENKQQLVANLLDKLDSQVFITGIHAKELESICSSSSESKMFHVKHGEVMSQRVAETRVE